MGYGEEVINMNTNENKPNCHLDAAYSLMWESQKKHTEGDIEGAAKLLENAALQFEAAGSHRNAVGCRADAKELRNPAL